MNFYILTLFPEIADAFNSHSIISRARAAGIININCVNIRDFAFDKHGHVDDYLYGGGAGMLMSPKPVYDAYMSIKGRLAENTRVVYMTPHGRTFNQKNAQEYSQENDLVILCGHYEGIDQRIIDMIVTDEVSLGDFVLTGGELAASVIVDAVSRLVPGVLGNNESSQTESFSDGLLECPQYTRPYEFMGQTVPEVLISGHHKNIAKWREEQSLAVTKKKRPDLLESEE